MPLFFIIMSYSVSAYEKHDYLYDANINGVHMYNITSFFELFSINPHNNPDVFDKIRASSPAFRASVLSHYEDVKVRRYVLQTLERIKQECTLNIQTQEKLYNDYGAKVGQHVLNNMKIISIIEKELEFCMALTCNEQAIDVAPIAETPTSKTDKLIKGVKELAKYLGIGVTKAQEILNSGLLKPNAVAYRNGKGWRINAEKLDKLLSDNPDIFRGVLKKDFDL